MRLNLQSIIHVPGASMPFAFEIDLSNTEFYGSFPIPHPLEVSGIVRNAAGALVLEGRASTCLVLSCDRCACQFSREKLVELDFLLAKELEGEEDEIVLLDGDELDVSDLASTAFILDMDTKNLCSEDCKGLCPGCGVNLNIQPCRCKSEVDPRLAALAQLLDKTE
ncbi:MAG: DUF177 domain-containing protein [Evtepia sp.]